MIDLSGVARHLRLSVDQLRVVADLLQQGYQPGFIERYRADETGNLPRATLWLLKLEIDRQLRLQTARDKAASQLPKDAELDAEGIKYLERATTEVEIEATLRAFRSRRQLSQNQESDKQSSHLLEKLIEYQGPPIDDLTAWSAEQLSIETAEAEIALQHAARLVGMLMHSDSGLNENLRRSIQRRAQVRVDLCDPTQADASDAPQDSAGDAHAADESQSARDTSATGDTSAASDSAQSDSPADLLNEVQGVVDSNQPLTVRDAAVESVANLETGTIDTIAVVPNSDTSVVGDVNDSNSAELALKSAAGLSMEVDSALPTHDNQAESALSTTETSTEAIVIGEPTGATMESPEKATEKTSVAAISKKKGAKGKEKENKPAKKPVAKMTPRQRRRRWLIAMLQPMKSLKCPLSKLSSYQQLMLGRGRRSQLVKTELQYDKQALVAVARDTFVNDKHPLTKWFSQAAQEALEHSLFAKSEADAVNDLEEIAAQRLLENSVDQLRQSLMQRPVRGHCILVIDSVGPKAAAVAVVDPTGQVLAIDEIPVSASPGIVTQNVTRLGELVHQYRVTLVALTNGPARRFLVLSLRELIKQSASSGLRWTMADRSGADAYAVSRSALKELSLHNRRHRAAIWVGRSLQDPLNELLKVDVNRLRLGSFQRELPQEPLKKLVREIISDCVYEYGLNTHRASLDQLSCVPGVSASQAQQIASLASTGAITSRKGLLEQVGDWSEMDARQAIGVLRVFSGEQPLDATTIHPDDYRLAERLIENTDLAMPPSAPEGWSQPNHDAPIAVGAVSDEPGTSSPAAEASTEASTESTNEPAPTETSVESPILSEHAEISQLEAVSLATADETEPSSETLPSTVETNTAPEVEVPTETAGNENAEAVEAKPTTEGNSEPVAGEGPVVTNWPTKSGTTAPAWPKPEYPEDIVVVPATPPTVDVEKLARGWQVGREKLRQVAGCLHAPFADPRLARPPVPLMTEMPTLSNLQPGMCVWAVIIGVADFGAFVELAPDCSGLIHISRLSANYIEDSHQCVQVGDLVMAWVVSVDEKKNRVALTALSPSERAAAEAATAARKAEQDEHRRRDRGGQGSGGGHRPAATQGHTGGGQGASHARGGQARSGGADGRRSGGGGGGGGGGRSRGNQHSQGRGRGGPPHSKTVVVTSKKPKANITDAMKEGEEPLRSFSDLMQFYQAKRTDDAPPPKPPETPSADES